MERIEKESKNDEDKKQKENKETNPRQTKENKDTNQEKGKGLLQNLIDKAKKTGSHKKKKEDENHPPNFNLPPSNLDSNTNKKDKEKKEKKDWKIMRAFQGHRDGVWELSTSEV